MMLNNDCQGNDFGRTPEPQTKSAAKQRFVIQTQHILHSHYVFRMELPLESGGEVMLVSWVVPKNLPMEGAAKHLAIRMENFSVEGFKFERALSLETYESGEMVVWDSGLWGLMKGSLEEGMIKFNLNGELIRGRFFMKRIADKHQQGKNKEYWLVSKMVDPLLT